TAATPSGGSGSYTSYQWYKGGSPVSLATSSSWTYSPSSAATSTPVTVTVTDSLTATSAQSTGVSITVNSVPTISVQPSSANIDSGQQVTLSSTVTGGTGTFSWQWYDSGGSISGKSGTGLTATYTVSAADTGIYVIFTDTGTSVTPHPTVTSSPNVAVTLDFAPSISTQPSSATIDSGQAITLSSAVTGGTGSFSWQWYNSGGSISGASGTGATATHAFTAATIGIYVVFTDTGTGTATPTKTANSSPNVAVTVDSAPSISTQPSSATIDSGQSISLSSGVSGGTGTFTWQCYTHSGTSVGSGSGTSASQSVSAADSGYYFVFTDTGVTSGASPAATATSSGASVTVNADPTVTVSPATVTMDVGQPQTFTANPAGGSGTYPATGYQWYVGGVAQNNQNAKTFSYSGYAGSPVITVTVTDSLGWTSVQSAAPSVTVNQLTISPSAGSNGGISPNTLQNVNYGATPSFTITPNTGYSILDVQVDSVSVLADMVDNVYTFAAVSADHSITATFASDAINTRLTVAISPTTYDKNNPNPETITISGTLTDVSSNPLTGQTITLWCNDGHDWVQIDPASTVTTITGGAYSYAWKDCPTTLPNGYYVIEARFAQNDPYQSSYADTNTTGNGNNLNVLPEYAIGALAALGACLAGFAVFKKRSSLSNLKLHI
ncbi:MAG: hypothetical protein ABSE15_03095, partial [Candidatus Bathyarchaeia archaeon]